jgi:hypothetical protein
MLSPGTDRVDEAGRMPNTGSAAMPNKFGCVAGIGVRIADSAFGMFRNPSELADRKGESDAG